MPADTNLYAIFYIHPQLQQVESEEEGRPVYKDVEYIQINIKGQKNSNFSRPVREEDKENYPKAWAAFRANRPDLTDGTPIKFLPGMSPSVELELKSIGVLSIEDMANLTDAGIMNIRGGRMLNTRAKAYLAACEIMPDKEPRARIDDPVDVGAMQKDQNVIAKEPVKKKRKYTKRNVA